MTCPFGSRSLDHYGMYPRSCTGELHPRANLMQDGDPHLSRMLQLGRDLLGLWADVNIVQTDVTEVL